MCWLDDPLCGEVKPSDGRVMVLPSTEPHEVRVKLMNPHQGLTPHTKLKVMKNN